MVIFLSTAIVHTVVIAKVSEWETGLRPVPKVRLSWKSEEGLDRMIS